ncbi:protein HOTHEAD-like [Trifolium medium]|uniref:Protein HOTHEAD-like n=1 Tax=Trifolium medium TaxID=97028 RepID=A0A392QMW8_9FABA|nr:protein HOTHEAD-like [Trifolium medium]
MGWDAKLVNKSYPWVEKQIVHRPTFSHWQRALRDGLLDAGVSPFNGFTYEHKYGTKLGGTIFDRFGRRHTAAELLASGNPNKLTVLIYATVQKIVFDTTEFGLSTQSYKIGPYAYVLDWTYEALLR